MHGEVLMNSREGMIRVLMLPWLAHGHISPFLELAKALTKRNFYIYLCSTPINLNSIKQKCIEKVSNSIELIEIHLPSLPELPSHYHTTNGLPPQLMPTLKKAFDMSKTDFANILDTIDLHLLIYDFLQPWAPELASSRDIPSVLFFTIGAASCSYLHNTKKNPSSEFPFSSIFIQEHEKINMDRNIKSSTNDIKDSNRIEECIQRSCRFVLIRTSKTIEKRYIDYLSVLCQKRLIPVGSLIQEPIFEEDKPEIFQWHDRKGNKSVVFASFGSEYFLSKDEIEEIGHGLELSGVNFVWVVRFYLVADRNRVEEALPKELFDRLKDRGIIVDGWSPQAKILRHGCIGGFLSHCGWGSVMESIEFGVPIIGLPMHLDQPLNCRLVKEIGVGVEVMRNEHGRIDRDEVARVIKEVMKEENGEIVRKQTKEVVEEMRNKGKQEMDVVVEELLNLSFLGSSISTERKQY